jgi:peptidoglycan/xylan/chitin deacetylase (PgdA/CDA1 family)/TolA-binding protein
MYAAWHQFRPSELKFHLPAGFTPQKPHCRVTGAASCNTIAHRELTNYGSPVKIKPLAAIIAATTVLAIAAGGFYVANRNKQTASQPAAAPSESEKLNSGFKAVLASYRKVVVLLADEKSMNAKMHEESDRVGQALFHENQERIDKLDDDLEALTKVTNASRFDTIDALLTYVESDSDLYDADRLAFRELLQSLRGYVAKDSSLPAIKLHKRISEDLDALTEIERNYDKEIRQIFGRFEQRAIELKRERWGDYLAKLNKIYTREQILKEYGVVMPYPEQKDAPTSSAAIPVEDEVFGSTLPKKTILLTFDDGPHNVYTAEIAAILKQYNAPAIFFSVGRNLGTLDAAGKAKLSSRAEVSRKLKAAGFVLANHSFSHAQLSKQTGDSLKAEIINTDTLLKAVDADRSPLFRFPYGARNSEGMKILADEHLRSIMWNIDSLDWADPVPSSISDRVLRAVDQQGRGIILFHDIHERTVKALPTILDKLVADGYQFAGWDGKEFKVTASKTPAADKTPISTDYANSWAIVIGIDNYAKWPKLQYAARDADGVRQTLIEKFGFASERVVSLKNEEATRNGILAAFHDRLAHGGIQRNDRIFVFFAGHGATRKLSSGRDLGYIVPVDSDPNQFATDAIPMTEIQNIAESLTAKHVLFVMDACYSGLGLTRGGGSNAFLRDNAKRIGRQMLTAGGTDQLVADGGPNGHSVFTWALLQGLAGKADMNGDGLITATELAAYIAPSVASVSNQTPAFGSLPGSEGGDFVFELQAETEFINPQTQQLSGDAIALNSKLDASRPATPPVTETKQTGSTTPAPVAVTVKDLQGVEQKIVPPAAVPTSARQLAQRANDRGLQLYKEKQYAAAEAQFTEALKLRPEFALAANNLGFVFYKQEKYKEAARWFENTVKIDPSRAIAYLNLGDAYAHSGDSDKAKKAFQTYLELAPTSSAAAYARQQIEKL